MKERIKLLTIDEVSSLLSLKVSWIRSAVFRKQIPFIKTGRLLRFDLDELKSWLESNRGEVKFNNHRSEKGNSHELCK